MIIVTGATGHLGRAVVHALLERMPATGVGISVRDLQKAGDLAALGVRVRRGDFTEFDGLMSAFEGVTQLFLVSSNVAATGGDPLAQHRAAINAAVAAGARRIVYTSHMAASRASAFAPMLDHAATEVMLSESGIAWTALRHGFYASSGMWLLGEGLKTGVVAAPEDGNISWTTHEDLAKADAAIIADEGRFDGPTPALTGSEALDLQSLAEIASKVTGKPIERKTLSVAEMRAKLSANGLPEPIINISMGLYRAAHLGEFATVDPTLEDLIGRQPIRMHDVISRSLAAK